MPIKAENQAIIAAILERVPFDKEKTTLPELSLAKKKEVLGLKEQEDLTEQAIKEAYKKLALHVHPDKQGYDLSDDERKTVYHAWSVLSNSYQKLLLYLKNPNQNQNDFLTEESPYVKGAIVAALREKFCKLGGINIQKVGETIESNAKTIEKAFEGIFPETDKGRNEKEKMEELIRLIFPQEYLPSSTISEKKTSAEWLAEKTFLENIIANNPELEEKISANFNKICHSFMGKVFKEMEEKFSTLGELQELKDFKVTSFKNFISLACKLDEEAIENFPDDPEYIALLDDFIKKNPQAVNQVLNLIENLHQKYGSTEIVKETILDFMKVLYDSKNRDSFFSHYSKNYEERNERNLKESLLGSGDIDFSYGLIHHVQKRLSTIEKFMPILAGPNPVAEMADSRALADKLHELRTELVSLHPGAEEHIFYPKYMKDAIRLVQAGSPELMNKSYEIYGVGGSMIADAVRLIQHEISRTEWFLKAARKQEDKKEKEAMEITLSKKNNFHQELTQLSERAIKNLATQEEKYYQVWPAGKDYYIFCGVRTSDPDSFYIEFVDKKTRTMLHQLTLKEGKVTSFMNGESCSPAMHLNYMENESIVELLEAQIPQLKAAQEEKKEEEKVDEAVVKPVEMVIPLDEKNSFHQELAQLSTRVRKNLRLKDTKCYTIEDQPHKGRRIECGVRTSDPDSFYIELHDDTKNSDTMYCQISLKNGNFTTYMNGKTYPPGAYLTMVEQNKILGILQEKLPKLEAQKAPPTRSRGAALPKPVVMQIPIDKKNDFDKELGELSEEVKAYMRSRKSWDDKFYRKILSEDKDYYIVCGVRALDPSSFYIELRHRGEGEPNNMFHQITLKDGEITSYINKEVPPGDHLEFIRDEGVVKILKTTLSEIKDAEVQAKVAKAEAAKAEAVKVETVKAEAIKIVPKPKSPPNLKHLYEGQEKIGQDYTEAILLPDEKTILGICEVNGNSLHRSQEDAIAYEAGESSEQFSKLTAAEQEAVMKTTFASLQEKHGQVERPGSCACVATGYLRENRATISTSYVGDSVSFLIVLDQHGKLKRTQACNPNLHNLDNPAEVAAIRNGTGRKQNPEVVLGQERLGFLNISRSLGDNKCSKFGLSHEPETTTVTYDIQAGDQVFMVVACDGVTEPFDEDDAEDGKVAIAAAEKIGEIFANAFQEATPPSPERLAELIVDDALERYSKDNISAMVVPLHLDAAPITAAVFDGHGGNQVSQALSDNFIVHFKEAISYRKDAEVQAQEAEAVKAETLKAEAAKKVGGVTQQKVVPAEILRGRKWQDVRVEKVSKKSLFKKWKKEYIKITVPHQVEVQAAFDINKDLKSLFNPLKVVFNDKSNVLKINRSDMSAERYRHYMSKIEDLGWHISEPKLSKKTKAGTQVETQAEAQPQVQAEAQAQVEEIEAEAEIEVQAETEAAEAESQAEAQAESKTEAQAESKTEAQEEAQAKSSPASISITLEIPPDADPQRSKVQRQPSEPLSENEWYTLPNKVSCLKLPDNPSESIEEYYQSISESTPKSEGRGIEKISLSPLEPGERRLMHYSAAESQVPYLVGHNFPNCLVLEACVSPGKKIDLDFVLPPSLVLESDTKNANFNVFLFEFVSQGIENAIKNMKQNNPTGKPTIHLNKWDSLKEPTPKELAVIQYCQFMGYACKNNQGMTIDKAAILTKHQMVHEKSGPYYQAFSDFIHSRGTDKTAEDKARETPSQSIRLQ